MKIVNSELKNFKKLLVCFCQSHSGSLKQYERMQGLYNMALVSTI